MRRVFTSVSVLCQHFYTSAINILTTKPTLLLALVATGLGVQVIWYANNALYVSEQYEKAVLEKKLTSPAKLPKDKNSKAP